MTSGHWSEEIPKATATGQPGPSGLGEIRSHPASGYLGAPWAQRDPEPPGAGRPQATGLGKPRATRRRDTSGPTGLRGTPAPPARGAFGPLVRRKPQATAKGHLGPTGLGGIPEPPGEGKPCASGAGGVSATGEGETPSHPAREYLSRRWSGQPDHWHGCRPGRRSSGAKDAEKSAGRRRETRRGRCISYMQRPRPIVPEPPKSCSYRHAARPARPFPARHSGGPGHTALPPPRLCYWPLAVSPSASGPRQARPPATRRRPAERPAGKPGTRATGHRAGSGRRGRRG